MIGRRRSRQAIERLQSNTLLQMITSHIKQRTETNWKPFRLPVLPRRLPLLLLLCMPPPRRLPLLLLLCMPPGNAAASDASGNSSCDSWHVAPPSSAWCSAMTKSRFLSSMLSVW